MLSDSKRNKSFYLVTSLGSIIIMIVLLVFFFLSYKNNDRFFAPYNPLSNKYIAVSGENGLQYINLPSGVDAFIDNNSTFSSQKESMIQRALSLLQTNGTSAGYINTDSTSINNNFTAYFFFIFILVIFVGSLTSYVAFNEST